MTTEQPYDGQNHAAPGAPVIDVEVVEELPPRTSGAADARSEDAAEAALPPPSLQAKVYMVLLVGALVLTLVLLNQQSQAIPYVPEAGPSIGPVTVVYPSSDAVMPAVMPTVRDEAGHTENLARISRNVEEMNTAMKRLNQRLMTGDKMRLSESEYRTLLVKLAKENNLTDENEVRRLLQQAGYRLPARSPDETRAALKTSKRQANRLDFVRSVASQLIQDEVEGFLFKVRVATEVGAFVADDVSR